MKTLSFYGLVVAVAGMLLMLVLFFLGFHSDPEKLAAAKWIGGVGGLAIVIVGTALGVRARRSELPPENGFGYGQALWAGFLISAIAAPLNAIFAYVYYEYINSDFTEILVQAQMDKLHERGMSDRQLEQAERFSRVFSSPGALAIIGLFSGLIMGAVISLVVAAFLRRSKPKIFEA